MEVTCGCRESCWSRCSRRSPSAPAAPARAQNNPFLGDWNITGDPPNTGNIYWLQVKDEGGTLSALFLNRGGSPVPAKDVKIANGELTFTLAGDDPKAVVSLREAGGKLTGTVGAQAVKVTGERPPKWGACDANAAHTFGKPVALFDGTSVAAWDVQDKGKPMGWSVEEGAMTNDAARPTTSSRRRSSRTSASTPSTSCRPRATAASTCAAATRCRCSTMPARRRASVHGHMAIYARKAPDKNVSKPAGEWQTAQITIVGNCVTAVLNGTDHPEQRQDHRHHRRSAGREGDRARPDRDPGRSREGVVQESDRHADHEVTVVLTKEARREQPCAREPCC